MPPGGDLPLLSEVHLRRLTSLRLVRLLDALADGPLSVADAKRIARQGVDATGLLRSVHGVLIDLDIDAARVAPLVRWPELRSDLAIRRLLAEGMPCSHIRGILAAHIAGPVTGIRHLARITGMDRTAARAVHACLADLDLLSVGAPELAFDHPQARRDSGSARAIRESSHSQPGAIPELPHPQPGRIPESTHPGSRARVHLKDIKDKKERKRDPSPSIPLPSLLNPEPDHPDVPEPIAVLAEHGVEPEVAAGLLAWHPIEVELLTAGPHRAAIGTTARALLVQAGVYDKVARRCWSRRPGRTLEVCAMLNTLLNRPEVYGVDFEVGAGLFVHLIEADDTDFLPRVRALRRLEEPPHAAAARRAPASDPPPAEVQADSPGPPRETEPDGLRAEPDDPARRAWRTARSALALQLTVAEYDTLVEPCRFLSCEDGELRLLVPNSVARDLLGHRLRPWLKEHLAQQLGAYVDVHLILDAAAPPEPVPDIKGRLIAAGVYEHVAAQLVRDYGPAVCRAELDRHVHGAQAGGLLVQAIRARGNRDRRA